MEFIGVFIIVLIILLVFRSHRKRKARRKASRSSVMYALVFIYNGDYSKATYICDPDYRDGQIVIVDYKGSKYAGRILDLDDERPDDIPKNVKFKPILKRFRWSDKKSLAYWSERVQEVIEDEIGSEK
jgi:hypothetical protein